MAKESDPFKALLTLGIMIACIPWCAFVLSVLWGWFAVPLGLPQVGKAHVYGLLTIFQLARSRYTKDDDTVSATEKVAYYALAPALSLLAGYIAHSLM